MNIVSYGGGTNSSAMLIGMVERSIPVDLILFADTGGEKPHTYEYVQLFSDWLVAHGMPSIEIVKNERRKTATLELDCLHYKRLPGIAYGIKSCSVEWKRKPIERRLKGMNKITYIGFDADEPHRAKYENGNRYPLIEWGWGRDECIEAIKRVGLPLPGKSSCFFCPSSKKHEIIDLKLRYPDLAARAVAMEKNAVLTSVKGLGRDFAWGDLLAFDAAQIKLFPESPISIDCGCYDEAEA